MSYKLWVLVAGLISHTWCVVGFQDTAARMISSMLCAFIMGIGIVLVGDKFEHLENEVAKLREQITQPEKSDESAVENNR
jgi:hypothetical protein